MIKRYICPSKVNICLRVLDRRKDGYHNLWSIFVPISNPCDEMKIEPGAKKGLEIECNVEALKKDNIIFKAYDLFGRKTGIWPNLKITLIKNIPMGAGLGGGSSNAATFLEYLKEHYISLNNREKERLILDIASKCGADVPFFLIKKPCIVQGIGDKLTEITISFKNSFLLVIFPKVHISTAWTYTKLDEFRQIGETNLTSNSFDIKYTAHLRGRLWINDFEPVVYRFYKELNEIKAKVLELGARACVLSGSGSSLVALIPDDETLDLIKNFFSVKGYLLFVNKGV